MYKTGFVAIILERVKGLEPSTSTLARLRSTTELHPQKYSYKYYSFLYDTFASINFINIINN